MTAVVSVCQGGRSRSLGAALIALAGCDRITNSPHPAGAETTNTFFTAFQERSPKYLDPTASYSIDETPYTYSIYEPLYRFHYLKRPYEVAPRAAERVVEPRYYDKDGRELPADAPGDQVAEAVYDIPLRKGIRFAPHPAFARDANGQLPVPRHDRGADGRQAHALRLPADGHPRADRARLRLRLQAPRHHAHQVAVVLDLRRPHRRPEGVRREDRRVRQGAARDGRSGQPRPALPRLPQDRPRGRRRRSTTTRCASA